MLGEHGVPDGQLGLAVLAGALFLVGLALVDELDDLGKTNAADDEGGEGYAAQQVHVAELIPGSAGQGVHADGGHQNAQHGDDDALDGILADQPADGGHGNQQDQGHLGIAELQTQGRQTGGCESQDQDADGASDEAGQVGRHQCLAGPALPGHGIAVQSGGDGRGVTGDVQQNGAEGAAVHIGIVQGAQHDDSGGGVEFISQRQQQGAARQGADAGHCAHDQAQDSAQQAGADVFRGEGHLETGQKR